MPRSTVCRCAGCKAHAGPCGQLASGLRCERCPSQRPGGADLNPVYRTTAWRTLSKRRIAEWVAAHGWWCPGYEPARHTPHVSTDLTLDHTLGGGAPAGPTSVMCRSVNSTKQHLDRRAKRRWVCRR